MLELVDRRRLLTAGGIAAMGGVVALSGCGKPGVPAADKRVLRVSIVGKGDGDT